MPCYNAAPHVDAMIASIFEQTYDNIELLIGYDESTDNTLQILQLWENRFTDKGYEYKIIHNNSNAGIPGGINAALPYFTGDYVTFPDSDDYMFPNFVSTMVTSLEENPEYNWSRSNGIVVNGDNLDVIIRRDSAYDPLYASIDDALSILFHFIPRSLWRTMIRTDFFLKVFPNRAIYPHPTSHELSINLPLAVSGAFFHVDMSLYKYINRESSYMLSRNTSIHKQIPYLDTCTVLANEIIMQLPIEKARKELYFMASDISTYGKKAETAIRFNQPYLAMTYTELMFEAILRFNPELIVASGFNLTMYSRFLIPYRGNFAVGIYKDIAKDSTYWRKLTQHERIILWGAGNNCIELLPIIKDMDIRVVEIWDSNSQSVSEICGTKVQKPHGSAGADALVVVTIQSTAAYVKIFPELLSMGYSNIFTFWNVFSALRYGMMEKYFPIMIK